MNITQQEIEKLRQLVASGIEKNGAISETRLSSTNCSGCSGYCTGSCNNFCTYSCSTYCDGNSGTCWKSWKGR